MTERISQEEFKNKYGSDLGKLRSKLALEPSKGISKVISAEKESAKADKRSKTAFVLPFPPSLNMMYPTNKQGRRFLSSRGQKFKKDAQLAMEKQGVGMFKGNLIITLKLFRPKKQGDIDNYSKAVFDSMKDIVIEDDKQIVELHIYRLDDKTCPRVEVNIEEIVL